MCHTRMVNALANSGCKLAAGGTGSENEARVPWELLQSTYPVWTMGCKTVQQTVQ